MLLLLLLQALEELTHKVVNAIFVGLQNLQVNAVA
jgi:hypothetical protein